MNDIMLLVLAGLIGIGVGFAMGILVCSLRGERKIAEDNQPTATPSSPQSSPIMNPVYNEPILAEPVPARIIQPPSINLVDAMTHAIQPKTSDLKEPPLSITGQIDEILQEKLLESPVKNKAVRLVEDPGKGVVVMVGMDHYEGVEAVPDPEIRYLIRSAVTEWESRASIDNSEA